MEIDQQTGSMSNMPIGTATVEEAVIVVAKRNPVHPVRAYLSSLKWDGKKRVENWLAHYLGTVDTTYTRSIGRWWLISAIARIFEPGCQADHVLTLEGGQGEGKSTALRTLGAPWFTDEVADLSSKDALMQMHGVWIVEFAEFDTLSRSEATRSKAFITARIDRFRLPYSKTVEEFPRSCVCAATVNGSAYLKDDTGNRRFWPVAVANEHPIALDELAIDRDQILAEAVSLYQGKASWWPSDPSLRDLLGTQQRERLIDDDWEQPIVAYLRERLSRTDCTYAARLRSFEFVPDSLRPCGSCSWCLKQYGITTYDILRGALELDKQRIDRSAQTRAGSCLLRLGYTKSRVSDGDRRLWVYLPPPPDDISGTGPPLKQAAE
jgi:putative DNA primase/helicase